VLFGTFGQNKVVTEVAVCCADSKPMPDFFIDDEAVETSPQFHTRTDEGSESSQSQSPADNELAKTFTAIGGMIRADVVESIQAVYVFDLKGSVLLM